MTRYRVKRAAVHLNFRSGLQEPTEPIRYRGSLLTPSDVERLRDGHLELLVEGGFVEPVEVDATTGGVR